MGAAITESLAESAEAASPAVPLAHAGRSTPCVGW
jgi:uncharacterized protein (UPF0261 family)